jgi:hypothetical protein
VKDNKAVFPDGMSYLALVLPSETAIYLDVLRKLESLVKAGLTVIGPRPLKATGLTHYPESDKEVNAIASRMWGKMDGVKVQENHYGKGRVIFGKDVNTVLAEMKVKPDLQFTSTEANTGIDYIHRTTDNMEIYFIVNRFGRKGINDFEFRYLTSLPDRYEQVECKFRVTGMVPELWDPMTGLSKEILTYSEENGQTIISLNLEPEGSQFIVFRKGAKAPHITSIIKDGKVLFPGNQFLGVDKQSVEVVKSNGKVDYSLFSPGDYRFTWTDGKIVEKSLKSANETLPLSGKWNLGFDTLWGGPKNIEVDSLKSWTLFENDGVKYYSGAGVYSKTFTVNLSSLKGSKVLLDLGNVLEMASITINGKKMAVRWSAPFQFDITGYVKPGDNVLLVEVANLWPNRLIGDSKLPADKRFTKTNVKKYDVPDSEKLLRESGLLGPVTITFVHHELSDLAK